MTPMQDELRRRNQTGAALGSREPAGELVRDTSRLTIVLMAIICSPHMEYW